MNWERRFIWYLIALGRITPREAERLLVVIADGDDAILKLAVCGAMAWLALPQLHELSTGLAHTLTLFAPQLMESTHRALACLGQVWGGMQ
jgi:hypothetical protein